MRALLERHVSTIVCLTIILVPSIWQLASLHYCGRIDTLRDQNNLLNQQIAFLKDRLNYQEYSTKITASKLHSEIAKLHSPPKGSSGKLVFSKKSEPHLINGILSLRIPNLHDSVVDLSISTLIRYHVIEKNDLTKIEEEYLNKLMSNNLTTYDNKNALLTIPGLLSSKLTGYILTWR